VYYVDESQPPFVDVWRVVQIPTSAGQARLRIAEMEALRASRGAYTSEILYLSFQQNPGGGIFEFPFILRSENISTVDINRGALSDGWRFGQSPGLPSKWGNGTITANENASTLGGVLISIIYVRNNNCVAVITERTTEFKVGDCS
jgi:hypothetical protein